MLQDPNKGNMPKINPPEVVGNMIPSGFLKFNMGSKLFIYIILVSFVMACNKKQPEDSNADRYYTYIRYTDSLFNRGLDTIRLLPEDSLSIDRLTGYFRIVHPRGWYYDAGLLNKGIKEKTWKSYYVFTTEYVALMNSKQHKAGKLNGKCFSYTEDGELLITHNYKDNQQFGLQLEYLDEKKYWPIRSMNRVIM